MACRTSTHWMWSCLCRPAAATRLSLTLPFDLSVDTLSVDAYGDGETHSQTWRANAWSAKPGCKDPALVHAIVPSLVAAIKSDVGSWSFELTDEHAQWMAEHLFAFVYTNGVLQHDLIARKHADACVMQNAFSDAYPLLNVPLVNTSVRVIHNPNKSLDMWTALRAFNAYRIGVIDSLEVAKSAQMLDTEMPEPSTSITELRALYVCAFRLREHATIDVIMRLTPLVENNARVSPAGLARIGNERVVRNNHAVPLHAALYVTRVLLNFAVGLRNLARDQNIEGLYSMTRSFSTWSSMRQGTLLALTASSIDTSKFADAVHRAEMAIMTEYWALALLVKAVHATPDVRMSRQLIILNLVIVSKENEARFMHDVTPRVLDVFPVPRALLKTSNLFSLILERLVECNAFPEQPLMQSCCLLTTPSELRKTYKLLKIIDPCVTRLLECATCDAWDMPIDVPLSCIEDAMVKEDALRMQGNGKTMNLPPMPYTLNTLRAMRARATE